MCEFLIFQKQVLEKKKGLIFFGPKQYVTVEMAKINPTLSQLYCSTYCCRLWLFIFSLQYRAPYMPPTQQYPVAGGTPGFYPGTSPAEYPAYGKGFWPRPTATKHNH